MPASTSRSKRKPAMRELRFCELRQAGDRGIEGDAVIYGDVAKLPWGSERIEAGAFSPLGDVMLNRQHERAAPLARTGGGGLQLTDTPEGLRIAADLPATRDAEDVLELVRRRILRGLSIEFETTGERFEGRVRIVERANLFAVAVVDSPAYPQSLIEARAAAVAAIEKPEARRRRPWL